MPNQVYHNPSVRKLYALAKEEGLATSDTGAILAYSGEKTGRSPKDKRVVLEPSTKDIWWGPVNIPLAPELFTHYNRAAENILTKETDKLFIIDAYCGWDPAHQLRIRLYCTSAYHALFMRNMLIPAEKPFGAEHPPQFVIRNVGHVGLNSIPLDNVQRDESLSDTLVALRFSTMEMVIYGTRYAGEMKKGVLTLMMYLMPIRNQLCLHSSANIDSDHNLTLFFGLSGTGKTTLSADPRRHLIGDDEHVWSDTGVFNVEGGCYAKCIDLSPDKEPDIFGALCYGAVLENVVVNSLGKPDYTDASITENTRGSYPLEFIRNALIPAVVTDHPQHIVFLTCDTFGLLPPISKLDIEQAIYLFIAGYTSKVAGTEMGVKNPVPIFSSCFGEPFLVWQPTRYGELLRERLLKHKSQVWMLNTGWVEGSYGQGRRISIADSRRLLDAVHSGELEAGDFDTLPIFNVQIPRHCTGLSRQQLLDPRQVWPEGQAAYLEKLAELKQQFDLNYDIKTGVVQVEGGAIAFG